MLLQKEICNLISTGLLSGEGFRDNLLGVRQAYKAGFACITFPWCPFHRGITWPVTPELVASAAWDEIAHWTGGVYRSLAFSIHSPGRKKQPPHASEAEWGGREKQRRGDIEPACETRSEDAENPAQGGQREAISPTLTSSTKLRLNGKIMEVASLAS